MLIYTDISFRNLKYCNKLMSVRSFLMLYFHNKIYISIELYDANKIDTRHLSLILLINGRKQKTLSVQVIYADSKRIQYESFTSISTIMCRNCNNTSVKVSYYSTSQKNIFWYFSFRVVENGKETVTVTEDGKVVKHLVNGEEKQAIKGWRSLTNHN